MAIEMERQPEAAPRRHAQGDESESLVHPAEIVVPGFARRVAQKGRMIWLVMSRSVGVAGPRGGKHMHQSGTTNTLLEHRGDELILAVACLDHVLNPRSLRGRQGL